MKNRAEVVVIGAGIMGLSIAYHLARLGVTDIVVVDKSYLCGGASGRNGGGIRADALRPAGSKITRKDIFAELPFGNVGVVTELKGSDLLSALEHGVSKVEEKAGRFPQVSGVTFTYDPKLPSGTRVTEAKVGGKPLDPTATYKVATNDYMLKGGDGYGALTRGTVIVDASGAVLMATIVMDYVEAKKTVAPKVEGRIVAK